MTSFLSQHPGGRDQLLLGAGRDATVVFDSYHKETTTKFALIAVGLTVKGVGEVLCGQSCDQ